MQNNIGPVSGVKEIFQNLKKVFQDQPISIGDLRASLQEDLSSEPDFINLLEKHHDYLEESISVLVDKDASTQEKQAHLGRFLTVLNMHSKAEEETLYQSLKHASEKEVRLGAISSQDEHNLAQQLSQELKAMNFKKLWSEDIDAKAQVLANLVHRHIAEEETQMFSSAEEAVGSVKMIVLTNLYLEKCKTYLDEEMVADEMFASQQFHPQ